jgi:hypothetical protein
VVTRYPFAVAILPERGWEVKPKVGDHFWLIAEIQGEPALDMFPVGRE